MGEGRWCHHPTTMWKIGSVVASSIPDAKGTPLRVTLECDLCSYRRDYTLADEGSDQ